MVTTQLPPVTAGAQVEAHILRTRSDAAQVSARTKAVAAQGKEELETSKAEQTAQTESVPPEPKALEAAVETLNREISVVQRALQFSIDDGTGRTVVKVTDKESGEVVRQIPSEEVLALAKRISEHADAVEGVLVRMEL